MAPSVTSLFGGHILTAWRAGTKSLRVFHWIEIFSYRYGGNEKLEFSQLAEDTEIRRNTR